MPHENHEFAFDKLHSKADVDRFFRTIFPDFHDMMPDIADKWEDHPLSNLAIVRCYPWASGKVGLMGDAAHATVPFYGQGNHHEAATRPNVQRVFINRIAAVR